MHLNFIPVSFITLSIETFTGSFVSNSNNVLTAVSALASLARCFLSNYSQLNKKVSVVNSLELNDQDLIIKELMSKVDNHDEQGFQRFFFDLNQAGKQQEASAIAKRLLEEREEELHESTPLRERYELILKNFKEIYPYLNSYFSKSKAPGQGVGKNVISAKGVQHIIDELEKNEAFNGIPVSVCYSFNDFSIELQQALIAMSGDEDKHCFALRHRRHSKPNDFTNHITPIYIEKKNGIFEIFITDSGGSKRHWTKNIITFVKEELGEKFPQSSFKIYHYSGKKRQMDFTNCPIFSIRDLVHMSQDLETLNWMRNNCSSSKEANIFEVPFLHPKMMSTCQTFSYIDAYLKATHTQELNIYSKSKPQGKTLEDIIQRHTYEILTEKNGQHFLKKQNLKVVHLFLKYERLIIADGIIKGA